MSEDKIQSMSLAIVTDYSSLHAALRARAESLHVSRETVDHIAMLPDGYAAKLLAPEPIKILGKLSLGGVLEALGVKLVLVEDVEAMAKFAKKRVERDEKSVRKLNMVSMANATWLWTSKTARKLTKLRMDKISPDRRSRIARKAARARWRKAKI